MLAPVSVRALVLRILRVSGGAYGLDIIQKISDRTNGGINLTPGTVYPVLRDLQDEGLVREVEGEQRSSGRGRPRIFYELTDRGVEETKRIQVLIAQVFLADEDTSPATEPSSRWART